MNAPLDTEVYMQLPSGMLPSKWDGKICRLLKGIYGLKQSGLQWYTELSSTLVHLSLSRSEYDHVVFTTNDPINRLVIRVSMGDMLVTGPDINTINQFKAGLANRYDITDLGEAQWFLGFNISWDRS